MRWTQGFRQEVLDWTGGEFSSHNWDPSINNGEPFDAIYLDDGNTFAPDQRALLGDWVLRSPFGNLWAVPHEKFIETYTFE